MSFILKPGDPVYYPSISNSIFETDSCKQDKDILQIKIPSVYFMRDGKLKEDHSNPSIFPATKEWFEKLKVTFPDVHNPESFYKLQKKELVTEIINKFGFCHIAKKDNFKSLIINVIKQTDQLGHYAYPINPFTLKKVKSLEEYVEIPEDHSPSKCCTEVMEHEPDYGSKPGDDSWFETAEYVGLKPYKGE